MDIITIIANISKVIETFAQIKTEEIKDAQIKKSLISEVEL